MPVAGTMNARSIQHLYVFRDFGAFTYIRFSFIFTIYATVSIKKEAFVGNYLLLEIRRNESILNGNCACFVIVIRRYFNDYYKITNRLPRKYSHMEK